ncbi:MAG: methyltransferase domain-containing protein [Streptosporangiaceae bacterium]|nr:methyltransferase domain-containing protein [Streptosporangiaceae bacterium]
MVTDFDTYERELWAGRAGAYERGFARLTAGSAGPLLAAAGVSGGTRLLDVGCGPGVVAREAVRRGAVVSAVDSEPGMAEIAARNDRMLLPIAAICGHLRIRQVLSVFRPMLPWSASPWKLCISLFSGQGPTPILRKIRA